ncbi:hypothetical protein A9Q91_05865 [Candidatus Gracilibacteria bacterium 28_42_T64]|nr:hypothetical protein A9Q91_05865 [Candidatus Gracilibacteria bacterium 28_42_T64]
MMKNIVKNTFYASAGAGLLALNSVNAAPDFGLGKVDQKIGDTGQGADVTIQNIIANAMAFLAILAVVYLLWGGFNILTAGGDEEKVKTGRTIITQAAIGLVVIFIAGSIVTWVLGLLVGA